MWNAGRSFILVPLLVAIGVQAKRMPCGVLGKPKVYMFHDEILDEKIHPPIKRFHTTNWKVCLASGLRNNHRLALMVRQEKSFECQIFDMSYQADPGAFTNVTGKLEAHGYEFHCYYGNLFELDQAQETPGKTRAFSYSIIQSMEKLTRVFKVGSLLNEVAVADESECLIVGAEYAKDGNIMIQYLEPNEKRNITSCKIYRK